MSDNGGLTKFRIGISIVFVITLLILFFQLCYVLWRRGLHRRQHLTTGESDNNNSSPAVTTGSSIPYHSKELLYFFCWKNQARIRSSTTGDNTSNSDHEGAESDDFELDVLKLQELYGLFPIKEEKEEFEYLSDHHNIGDDDQSIFSVENMERVSSSEKSSDDECDSVVTIVIHHDDEEDIESSSTPYSTPCNSPPYYTPSPSPSRDDNHDIDNNHIEIHQV